MPDAVEKRLPKWPLWLALSLLVAFEVFFVVMIFGEGVAGNIPMVVNSVGLVVFSVLTWRGIPWSRWLLIVLLALRVGKAGIDMFSSFTPGDYRIGGALLLIAFYVAVGLLVASPLGRTRLRAAT